MSNLHARAIGRIRPLLAVGVLSLALVTGCSSSDEADTTTSGPTTAASSAGSSDTESASAPSDAPSSDEESSDTSTSATDNSAGAPTPEASAPAEATSGAESAAPGSEAAPADEAEEGTSCGGLTVAAVNEALGGTTLESAVDVTIDAATGDSSCLFGTTTTIDTVVVDKAGLTTYLGGDLDGLSDAEVLDNVEEFHVLAQTDVTSADSTVEGRTVRTLTGTDLTGGANALSVTVVDGTLLAVSATGPALAETGLSKVSLAVLELALKG